MRISDWSSDVCSSDLCGPWGWVLCYDGRHWRRVRRHHLSPARDSLWAGRLWANSDGYHRPGSDPPGGAANIGRRARPQREPKEIGVTRQDVLHATREEVAIAVEEEIGLGPTPVRSEEHTSELQSLMRISYAVFCLKKKKSRA